MQLYIAPRSPNSHKVLAVVRHLGLDVEISPVDLVAGEQMQPAFLAINPNHKTPALVDGDFALWESNAIMQYLAARHGENGLWPADARARADISRWQCWQLAHFGRHCDTVVFQRVARPALGMGEPDEAAVAAALADLKPYAKVLEAHLDRNEWLVGDGVSLADFSVGAPLVLRHPARLPFDGYPGITRWYAQLEALEAWQGPE